MSLANTMGSTFARGTGRPRGTMRQQQQQQQQLIGPLGMAARQTPCQHCRPACPTSSVQGVLPAIALSRRAVMAILLLFSQQPAAQAAIQPELAPDQSKYDPADPDLRAAATKLQVRPWWAVKLAKRGQACCCMRPAAPAGSGGLASHNSRGGGGGMDRAGGQIHRDQQALGGRCGALQEPGSWACVGPIVHVLV